MLTAKFSICHHFKSTSEIFLASTSCILCSLPYFRSSLSSACTCQLEEPSFLASQHLYLISSIHFFFFFYTADSRANFLKDKSDHGRYYVAIPNSSVAFFISFTIGCQCSKRAKTWESKTQREGKQREVSLTLYGLSHLIIPKWSTQQKMVTEG